MLISKLLRANLLLDDVSKRGPYQKYLKEGIISVNRSKAVLDEAAKTAAFFNISPTVTSGLNKQRSKLLSVVKNSKKSIPKLPVLSSSYINKGTDSVNYRSPNEERSLSPKNRRVMLRKLPISPHLSCYLPTST